MFPKALNGCPRCNKSPNLVTLIVVQEKLAKKDSQQWGQGFFGGSGCGIQCDQIGRFFGTLGNFFKPLETINLPKYLTFLGNFCKGIKMYHFSSEIHFWATFTDIWWFLSGHTGGIPSWRRCRQQRSAVRIRLRHGPSSQLTARRSPTYSLTTITGSKSCFCWLVQQWVLAGTHWKSTT